jgi:alkanesulfonate monooxygenase
LRFGISLLNFALAPEKPDLIQLWRYGKQAEELGFASVWAYDHVLLGTKRAYSFLDPFIVLAGLAASTRNVRLGTSVYLTALRHPIPTARLVSTIDHASAGRFIFGIGAGWYSKEFDAIGIPFDKRGRVVEECVGAMKSLWTEKTASYSGTFFNFDSVVMEPKPIQTPHPPILVGGHEDSALRRSVKIANGWIAFFENPAFVQKARTKIDEYAKNMSKPVPPIYAIIPACLADSRASAEVELANYVERNFNRPFQEVQAASAYGEAEDCSSRIREFERAGVEELVFLQTEPSVERLQAFHREVLK